MSEIVHNQLTHASFDLLSAQKEALKTTVLFQGSGEDIGLPLWIGRISESIRNDENWIKHINYPFGAIELILSGAMEYFNDGERCVARPGELYLICRGSNSRYRRQKEFGPLHKIYMIFHGRFLGLFLSYLGFHNDRLIRPENPEKIELAMREIGTLLNANEEKSNYLASEKLYGLLLELSWQAKSVSRFSPIPKPLIHGIKALTTMLDDPPNNSAVADYMAVGKSSMHNIFQKHLGTTPHRYQLEQRFRLAEELLKNTTFSIAEVAAQCGFRDPKYFITRFRVRFGMPPGKFRKLNFK